MENIIIIMMVDQVVLHQIQVVILLQIKVLHLKLWIIQNKEKRLDIIIKKQILMQIKKQSKM